MSATNKFRKEVDWKTLASCPIDGFELQDNGLYDTEQKKYVNSDEIRQFINSASKIEGRAQIVSTEDTFYFSREAAREVNGMYWPMACVALGATVLWAKLPHAWYSAVPANSYFLKFHKEYKTVWTARQREAFCRKHRAILTLTNLNMLIYGGFGISLILWGLGVRAVGKNPNKRLQLTQQNGRFHNHSEAVLQWLYAVYYNHPAYREEARSPKKDRHIFDFGDDPDKPRPDPTLLPWAKDKPHAKQREH